MKFPKLVVMAALISAAAYTPVSWGGDYLSDVSEKFIRGTANLFTGLIEVPKSISWASRETNIFAGIPGGIILGTLQTLGRTSTGVFDIISSPVPTKSMINPPYVSERFDDPTTYAAPEMTD